MHFYKPHHVGYEISSVYGKFTGKITIILWVVNQPPANVPPFKNQSFIKPCQGKPMIFISPDHKGPRLFLRGVR